MALQVMLGDQSKHTFLERALDKAFQHHFLGGSQIDLIGQPDIL